jgi:hypothetical protein
MTGLLLQISEAAKERIGDEKLFLVKLFDKAALVQLFDKLGPIRPAFRLT